MSVNYDVVPKSTYTEDGHRDARQLWGLLLAGPVIYALYFIFGYLLSEATCQQRLFGIGPERLAPIIGIVTGLAALLTMILAMASLQQWKRLRQQQDAASQALAFMAFGGLFLCALFTLLIIATGVAVFFVNTCQWL